MVIKNKVPMVQLHKVFMIKEFRKDMLYLIENYAFSNHSLAKHFQILPNSLANILKGSMPRNKTWIRIYPKYEALIQELIEFESSRNQ